MFLNRFWQKKKGKDPKSFLVSDEGFNPYMTVLVARRSFINKNLETTQSLVSSVREGWRAYLDHPEKTNAFMHKLNSSVDLESFHEIANAQKPFVETAETKKSGLGVMNFQRWKELANQLKEIGLIKAVPDVAQLFQNL